MYYGIYTTCGECIEMIFYRVHLVCLEIPGILVCLERE